MGRVLVTLLGRVLVTLLGRVLVTLFYRGATGGLPMLRDWEVFQELGGVQRWNLLEYCSLR